MIPEISSQTLLWNRSAVTENSQAVPGENLRAAERSPVSTPSKLKQLFPLNPKCFRVLKWGYSVHSHCLPLCSLFLLYKPLTSWEDDRIGAYQSLKNCFGSFPSYLGSGLQDKRCLRGACLPALERNPPCLISPSLQYLAKVSQYR